MMTRNERMRFELYVMDLASECQTKEEYERLSAELHEAVENAIQDMCMDFGIEDYEPSY